MYRKCVVTLPIKVNVLLYLIHILAFFLLMRNSWNMWALIKIAFYPIGLKNIFCYKYAMHALNIKLRKLRNTTCRVSDKGYCIYQIPIPSEDISHMISIIFSFQKTLFLRRRNTTCIWSSRRYSQHKYIYLYGKLIILATVFLSPK